MFKRKIIIVLSGLTLAIVIITSLMFNILSNRVIDSGTLLDGFEDKDLITNEQWISALIEVTGYEWFDDSLKTQDYATKDFIAQTAIQATGFIGNATIQFADAHLIEDVNSAGLSVKVEILEMERGSNFNPLKNMTIADCKKSINRINEIVAMPEIDPNHKDSIAYQKGVIDLSHMSANDIIINDSDGKSISFNKSDVPNIKEEDVYIIPPTTIFPNGMAFKVNSVSESNGIITINNAEADISEVISNIDIQGVYYPDLSNIQACSGVEYINNTASLYASLGHVQGDYVTPDNEIVLRFDDNDDDENDSPFSISGDIKVRPKITAICDVDFNLFRENEVNQLYFLVEVETELNASFTGKIEKAIPIANIPFYILPGVSIDLVVNLEPSLEGDVSISISNYGATGINHVNGVLCYIKPSFETRDIGMESSVTLELPLNVGVALNALNFSLLHGNVQMGIGATARMDLITRCIDASIYAILRLSIKALESDELELSYSIFDKPPSEGPKWECHFEDFVWVIECTRKKVVEESYTWKEHYIHYIQEGYNYNDARYQLIFINDDVIPELITCYNYRDDGFDINIMSYAEAHQSSHNTTAMGFSYIERGFLLHTYSHGYNDDGSRYRYDRVDEILNNSRPIEIGTMIISGACSFDAQGNFTYGYANNDELSLEYEVSSFEEYERLFDSGFDSSKAIRFDDIILLDSQEIISAIESY